MSPESENHDEMNDESRDTEVMTAYIEPEDDYEGYDDFADDADGRPRRLLVNRWTLLLAALVVGAGCFYAGVRVERSKVGSSSSAAGGLSGLASRFAAASGASGTSGTSRTSKSGSTSGFAGGGSFTGGAGAAGGFSGAPGAAGSGTSGTIASIDGDTLYITETSGNTVKVKLSDATTLKKTVTISKKSLYPGDSVTVSGSSGSGGAVTATSVSDTGASSTSSSTSSSSSTGSSSSGSSALSSLFGG